MVAKAVFHTSDGSMCICLYVLDISIFDRYLPQATSCLICSWSGKGVPSFFMFSFCFLPSMTVQSLAPPFLKMQSIGQLETHWSLPTIQHFYSPGFYRSTV